MLKPLAICIEDLDAESRTEKYVRCVALVGRQPGLRLDEAGRVVWRSEEGTACELWVSADGRLVLYRQEGMGRVTLHRAGRSLDVPCAKPVIVADKDRIDVGARRLRVHVHGEAPVVAAPSPLASRQRPFGRLAQAVTTAAVIGAVVAAGGCTDIWATPTIEVIDNPPEPPEPTPDPVVVNAIQGEWTVAQARDVADERIWITGTLTIEGDSYTFTPTHEITGTPEISGTSAQGDLDFLFDTPAGEVAIRYYSWGDISFAPGEELATCWFYASSGVAGEFGIIVGDAGSLRFHNPAGEDGLWSVTKRLEGDAGQ
jgi:hypothetical protein